MVRMRRAPFFKLCDLMHTLGLLLKTINVRIEEQVAMLLHTLGHSVRNRVKRFNFHRSGETVSKYFKAILHAVGELRNEFIKPPPPETPYMIKSSNRFMPFFKV
ncbi:hypothetical protein MA16_Dca000249 [Dendrobium catenatum]|uniref:DUF8040 domain-containing protein n=1 Tax=Dendrobium catenatum TaxID=906689 RepID=A0A2I0WTB8_9ASPA|nr:hypothetical protein MA16_Dca000249 [Dendrobium catenatum]